MGLGQRTWQLAKTKGWAMEKAGYAPVPSDVFVMLYKDDSGKLDQSTLVGFINQYSSREKKPTD